MPQVRCAHLKEVSQKWRMLAERRLAHFVELLESKRWKRYFSSEEDFLHQMRQAMLLSTRWAEIAPPPAPADEKKPRAAA
jgi:uncharacterized repeat protein (TIGR03809 family)